MSSASMPSAGLTDARWNGGQLWPGANHPPANMPSTTASALHRLRSTPPGQPGIGGMKHDSGSAKQLAAATLAIRGFRQPRPRPDHRNVCRAEPLHRDGRSRTRNPWQACVIGNCQRWQVMMACATVRICPAHPARRLAAFVLAGYMGSTDALFGGLLAHLADSPERPWRRHLSTAPPHRHFESCIPTIRSGKLTTLCKTSNRAARFLN